MTCLWKFAIKAEGVSIFEETKRLVQFEEALVIRDGEDLSGLTSVSQMEVPIRYQHRYYSTFRTPFFIRTRYDVFLGYRPIFSGKTE